MKVFWIYNWDTYYPSVDNYLASFETEEEADEYIKQYKLDSGIEEDEWDGDNFRIVDISNRL